MYRIVEKCVVAGLACTGVSEWPTLNKQKKPLSLFLIVIHHAMQTLTCSFACCQLRLLQNKSHTVQCLFAKLNCMWFVNWLSGYICLSDRTVVCACVWLYLTVRVCMAVCVLSLGDSDRHWHINTRHIVCVCMAVCAVMYVVKWTYPILMIA